jgi:transposase
LAPLARRTRERWELVQALRARGKGIKPITRETGLAKGTVRRFYRAATVDELLAKARDGRPSRPDDYKEHLHQRWNQGCTSVRQPHAEIRQRGYPGSYSTVRDYLQPFREPGAAPPAAPAPPKARDITRWLPSRPGSLDEDDKLKLKDARDRCPRVDALAGHVTAPAEILTGRHGERLDDWIAAVEVGDQPDLRSFVTGIKRDYDAVRNGLTLQWSSGAAEGNVNRLKVLKRQMYGHARFDLLRHRVLLTT